MTPAAADNRAREARPRDQGHVLSVFERDPTDIDDYRRVRTPSLCTDPERLIRGAVLETALAEIEKWGAIVSRGAAPDFVSWRKRYVQLRGWFAGDEPGWPYAFGELCAALGLAPEPIRAKVLAEAPPIDVHHAPRAAAPAAPPPTSPGLEPIVAAATMTRLDRMRAWIAAQDGPFRLGPLARAVGLYSAREIGGATRARLLRERTLRAVGSGWYVRGERCHG